MIQERIVAGCVVLFGATLLMFVIPAQVTSMPGSPVDPGLFPKAAAWIFVGLGLVHMVLPGKSNDPRIGLFELGRLCMIMVLLVMTALSMEYFGHIPAMMGLMAVSVFLVHERRWYWIATTVLALPVGCWALFEIVLERPLP